MQLHNIKQKNKQISINSCENKVLYGEAIFPNLYLSDGATLTDTIEAIKMIMMILKIA